MYPLRTSLVLATLMLSGAACAADHNKPNTASAHLAADTTQPVMDIEDRTAFDSAYPHARRVDLVTVDGATAPFNVNHVRFLGGGAQVLNSLVDLPPDYWFGAQTTSADFLLANLTVQISFPHPVQAAGFDLQCFACDLVGQPTLFTAILLAANGDVIGYQEYLLANLTGTPQSMPAFLGFDSDIPFSSIILHRDGNWLMMNLRYQPGERDSDL